MTELKLDSDRSLEALRNESPKRYSKEMPKR